MRLYKSSFSCYTCRKRESRVMSDEEISELDIRLAFYNVPAIEALLAKGVIASPRANANYIIE